jgi:2-polyprenyl-6-methoxyphenol hydroxylase-like FAD-dependent oxidoreductase
MLKSYDAIVIGGGPGGSTVSTFLSMAGRSVLLLEREQFPRYHIGESLLAGTADIMNKMGVLGKVEKRQLCKEALVSHGSGERSANRGPSISKMPWPHPTITASRLSESVRQNAFGQRARTWALKRSRAMLSLSYCGAVIV